MKSLLWGSALAASYLLVSGGTASAQRGYYAPSTLPASAPSRMMGYPDGRPTTYSSFQPIVRASEPLRTPSYTGDGGLTELVGGPSAPPHADAYSPAVLDHSVSCGGCDNCYPHGSWFAGVSSLLMKPDRANPYFFSHDRANEAHQLTNTQDAEIQWGGGFDVRLGRYLNCGSNAIEVVYWGLFPDNETTWATADSVASGNLDAILNFDDLNYNGGLANLSADGAQIHQVWHEQEYHNVEVNLLSISLDSCGGPGCGKCAQGKCSGLRTKNRLLFGARWFKFNDSLIFGADPDDRQFTFENDEIYYTIDMDNNLIGFQLGYEGEYALRSGWTADYGIKLGVFGNRIDHLSQIGGAAGIATVANGPNTSTPFFVDNTKTDVAFLGEANLGLEYQMNDCWTATFGYRAMAVTGVALPSNQIWHDLRGIQDVFQVDANGSLILHGGYLGLEYNY